MSTHILSMHKGALLIAHRQFFTYAAAFPWLQQLLCQSGKLITGKQICLESPHRTHTNKCTHTHTFLPSSQHLCHCSISSQHEGPKSLQVPRSYSNTTRSWKSRGKLLRLGGTPPSSHLCYPGASALTPAAMS